MSRTPTHWTYGEYADGSIRPGAWRVEEAPGARWVADAQSKDKARLISAAPVLLAALHQWQTFMHDNYQPDTLSWWNQTEAAIAKATGVPS